MSLTGVRTRREAASPGARVADYVELTKPRLTFLVLFAVLAGFLVGTSGSPDPVVLASTLLGVWLCAAGSHALNMMMEREADAVMARTASRPLPTGRLRPVDALVTGTVAAVAGTVWLALSVNLLAAALAAFTVLSYVFVYTPLKSRTSLNTLVGAVPGATPVLVGVAAGAGSLPSAAWFLFAVVFVWQIPHFLAIAVMHRDDYARAGYPMLPVLDPSGDLTSRQILLHTLTLVAVSLVPVASGAAGALYGAGAVLLGAGMFAPGLGFSRSRDRASARRVFLASLVYLPALLCLYVADGSFGVLS